MTIQDIIKDDIENGSLILKFGLMHNLAEFGAVSAYSGICGGGYEASLQWYDHNVYDLTEVENKKYVGYIVKDSDDREHKLYIKKSILNIKTTDWKYAFNCFKKFLIVKR